MTEEGLLDRREAVAKVTPDRLDELLHPVVEPGGSSRVLVEGLPASPGGAVGLVVFDADEAVRLASEGTDVVLVRHETSPDDFHGMVAAVAVVTSRGGVTSHAAVVARGMGKCCVVACEEMLVDYRKQLFETPEGIVSAGDVITVDGTSGVVYSGKIHMAEPELDSYYETFMSWADEIRDTGVRANADTAADALTARRLGAEGVGLCRTEHMFFGDERIGVMRKMVMARNEVERSEALSLLEPFQTDDFVDLFRAMDGLPVTIRLLDPPLHEFLPSALENSRDLVNAKLRLRDAADLNEIDGLIEEVNAIEQLERLSEVNPMLGHRGCRLGVTYPEITRMQSRAIFNAALKSQQSGIAARPEIMVPLVGFSEELSDQRAVVEEVAHEVLGPDPEVHYSIGTMIELPRSALTAGEIAEVADFVSFGTNDLTQTTLGLSRDDSSRFLPGYVRKGLIGADPFQQLDQAGVGELVAIGIERGRSRKDFLKVGVCGEHGGDPRSIEFLANLSVDYVSCSPYRVPVARLAAAHAALSVSVNAAK